MLEAARLGGVGLRSSCRNGTCRACLCQIVSGRVAYRIDWPGLSAEEKREGAVLPHNTATAQASGTEPPGSLNITVMPAWYEIAALGAANISAVQHDVGVQIVCSQ